MAGQLIPLPDGGAVRVRPGETEEQAWLRAQQSHPEAFGIEQKHGGIGAFKHALGEYLSDTAAGASDIPGLGGLRDVATKMAAPDQTPGAWKPTGEEETGVGNWLNRNIVEPGAGMAGSYLIPTVGSMAAGAAAAAPTGGFGALAAGPAAFTALAAPAEYARNRRQVEAANVERAAAGQSPEDAGQMTSLAAAIAQGALGGLGGPLARYTPKLLGMAGPELAALTKQVAAGAITKDAAAASLNTTLKNYAAKTAGAFVGGAELMTGTEALRRGQAGQDVASPEALETYWQGLKSSGALAPVLGLHGVTQRGGEMKKLDIADAQRQARLAEEKKVADAQAEAARREAAWKAGQGEQTGLGLEAPKQPKGKEVYRGGVYAAHDQAIREAQQQAALGNMDRGQAPESTYTPEHIQSVLSYMESRGATPEQLTTKQAEMEAGPAGQENQAPAYITAEFFDQHGIPPKGKGKELRNRYAGALLSDTDTMLKLQAELAPLADSKDPHAAAYAKAATTVEALLRTPEEHVGSVSGTTWAAEQQQNDFGFPTLDEQLAQETARRAEKAVETRGINKGQKPPTEEAGEQKVVDQSRPEVEPAEIASEFEEQNQALYDRFQKAHEQYQATGDVGALNEVLAQAHEQLGPYQERMNQASTQKLVDAKGKAILPKTAALEARHEQQRAALEKYLADPNRPMPESKKAGMRNRMLKRQALELKNEGVKNEQPTGVPSREDRTGNGPDVQGTPPAGAGGAGAEPTRARPSVRAAEQPVVAEKYEPVALKAEKPATLKTKAEKPVKEVKPVSDNVAAREWARSGAAAEYEQTYKELHPDAQGHLKAAITESKAAKKELTGKQLKEVLNKHVEASASRSARPGEEVAAEHTKEEAKAHVDEIKKGWTNAPETEVKDFSELHPEEQKWVDKNKAKGFIDDMTGKVTIVSDRNADLRDVKATLLHEALGHYGLRSKFREGLGKLMQDIYTASPKLHAEVDAVMKATGEKDVAKAVEEVLAERQVAGKIDQGVISRVRAWVQNFLRDHGIKLAFDEHDLRVILRRAHDEVVSGEKLAGPVVGERAARAKEKPFSDSIPAKQRVTIEHEGPDGEPVIKEVMAKPEMRAAEQRVNALKKLLECMGHA